MAGVIFDFAGSYYVQMDDMAFGLPARYWRLDPAKARRVVDPEHPESVRHRDEPWDTALQVRSLPIPAAALFHPPPPLPTPPRTTTPMPTTTTTGRHQQQHNHHHPHSGLGLGLTPAFRLALSWPSLPPPSSSHFSKYLSAHARESVKGACGMSTHAGACVYVCACARARACLAVPFCLCAQPPAVAVIWVRGSPSGFERLPAKCSAKRIWDGRGCRHLPTYTRPSSTTSSEKTAMHTWLTF